MADKIFKTRLYAPAEDESKPTERSVLYPETGIESVITRKDGTNLKDDIGPKIVVSQSDNPPSNESPSNTGRPLLFIRTNLGDAPDFVR